jgi:Tfp pilus assembly protein PilF
LWSENQGALATAGQQYEKALELAPQSPTALVAYARFHDRQGHAEEAARLYERARAAAPDNTLVLNDLGLYWARRGQWEPALEALNEAVQREPKSARYCNNLAAVLVQTGRIEDAVAVLRVVYPEPVVQYNTGYLLYLQQDFDRAAWHFRQASQLAPSFAAAREMLEQLDSPAARMAILTRPASARATGGGEVWPPDRQSRPPRKLPPVQ